MCPQVSLNNVSLACGSACYVMPLFFQMLTKFVAEKLVADAHLYELKRHDWIYMDLYTDFVWVSGTRIVGFHGQGGKTRFEVAPGVHLQGGRTRFGAPALTAVHGRKIEGAPGV
jgi:hypothetical protein